MQLRPWRPKGPSTGSITQDKKMTRSASVWPFVASMAAVVAASNFLVQFPFEHLGLQDFLTWGAFTYPFAFLVTDLTNRRYGPAAARKVVYVGFAIAVAFSVWLASPRIAIASGSAFLIAQLIDVFVFDRLRERTWWHAPFISSVIGSVIDTMIFFSLAFASTLSVLDTGFGLEDSSLGFLVPFFGREVPLWVSLAVGDFTVKLLLSVLMLVPYGALLSVVLPAGSLARRKG